jgi:hypothetical protein
MPTPILQNVTVQTETTFDLAAQQYTYQYSIANPSSNTGQIWNVLVEVTTTIPRAFGVPAFESSGLTIPTGVSLFTFDEELAKLQPMALPAGTTVIPFGQRVPAGWDGGLYRAGLASFSSGAPSSNIMQGKSLGGFELISRGMPTIRKIQVRPKWVLIVEGEATDDEKRAAGEIKRSIIFHTVCLGPSALTAGTFAHWDQVRDDLNQAKLLGWIPDAALADTLVTQLAAARQALDTGDGTLAKTRLQTLIQTITQSTDAQRRREVFDLVLLKAQRLKEATPDTVFPIEPKLKLAPQSSTLPLGTRYTLTATVVNLGDPANPPQARLYHGVDLQPGHIPGSL